MLNMFIQFMAISFMMSMFVIYGIFQDTFIDVLALITSTIVLCVGFTEGIMWAFPFFRQWKE